ncbi:MAG: class I SAM-dependent methyltransferase [Oscillatoriales cyanobacterium]|nr:MAG: class I SAM-dependent methyltransferase [Oscillatoriales cyanobacterium]TAG99301.1 MAG: class I SAM-dependent methyltransferase [Oscillatoriales cyanobacterium]
MNTYKSHTKTSAMNEDEIEDLSAYLYDYVFESRNDIFFYLDMANRFGGPILEAGCGTGRILLPLARAGFEIVGFDINTSRLAICETILAEESDEIRARASVVFGDMRNFTLNREFALLLTPFRSFQHLLTPEDQRTALLTMKRHLQPNGSLVLDIFNPSIPFLADSRYLKEFGDSPPIILPDGRQILQRDRVISRNYFNQTQEAEEIYYVRHPNGVEDRIVKSYSSRYTFPYELEHLLTSVGFSITTIFGDYDKSTFGDKYPGELIVVARKAE